MSFFHLILFVTTLLVMEGAVTLIHKYVMHGFGWGWHQSHHETRKGARWEKNDLYAIVFSAATILLFVAGGTHTALWWVALGITTYGLLYSILHDVVIHQRLPLKWRPESAYLKRLIKAHHLHHAVKTREGAVSFGFLYTPPLEVVRRQLRANARKT